MLNQATQKENICDVVVRFTTTRCFHELRPVVPNFRLPIEVINFHTCAPAPPSLLLLLSSIFFLICCIHPHEPSGNSSFFGFDCAGLDLSRLAGVALNSFRNWRSVFSSREHSF